MCLEVFFIFKKNLKIFSVCLFFLFMWPVIVGAAVVLNLYSAIVTCFLLTVHYGLMILGVCTTFTPSEICTSWTPPVLIIVCDIHFFNALFINFFFASSYVFGQTYFETFFRLGFKWFRRTEDSFISKTVVCILRSSWISAFIFMF